MGKGSVHETVAIAGFGLLKSFSVSFEDFQVASDTVHNSAKFV